MDVQKQNVSGQDFYPSPSERESYCEVWVEVTPSKARNKVAYPIASSLVSIGVAECKPRVEADDEIAKIAANAQPRTDSDIFVRVEAKLGAGARGIVLEGPDIAAVKKNSPFEPRKNVETQLAVELETKIGGLIKRLSSGWVGPAQVIARHKSTGADFADAPCTDAGRAAHKKLFHKRRGFGVAKRHYHPRSDAYCAREVFPKIAGIYTIHLRAEVLCKIKVCDSPFLFAESCRPKPVERQLFQTGNVGAEAVVPSFAETVVGAEIIVGESTHDDASEELVAKAVYQKLVPTKNGVELWLGAWAQHINADVVEGVSVMAVV